jgi:hypothetical protein
MSTRMSTSTDTRECLECGSGFTPRSGRHPAKTCSPRCRGRYSRRFRAEDQAEQEQREQPARETTIADRLLVGSIHLWLADYDQALASFLFDDHGLTSLEDLRRAWASMPLADRAEYA